METRKERARSPPGTWLMAKPGNASDIPWNRSPNNRPPCGERCEKPWPRPFDRRFTDFSCQQFPRRRTEPRIPRSARRSSVNHVNVRATMARVPWSQHFLTWLTGKALPGQEPLLRSNPALQLVTGLLGLLAGVAGSVVILSFPWWLWPLGLPFSWVLTVGSARKLQIMICHQCVHHQFSGNKLVDRGVCEIVSTLLMVQDYQGYYHDHRDVHHGKELATLDDPDLKFLIELKFLPGMSRRALWRHLGRTLVSLRFHGFFLFGRLRANLMGRAPYRRAMAVVFHGALLAAVLATGQLEVFLVAWLFPLTLLYHIASLLQFLGEHKWLRVRRSEESARIYLARLTSGRFLGEPAPEPGLPPFRALLRWTVWAARMLTYHLFCRVFVLVADLPVHDWHHRHPASRNWPNALYARQRDIDAGCPRWEEPYSEVWGLHRSIDAVFELFSGLNGATYDSRPMPALRIEEVLRSM